MFLLVGAQVCLINKKEKIKSCRNLILTVLALLVLLGNQIFVDKIPLLLTSTKSLLFYFPFLTFCTSGLMYWIIAVINMDYVRIISLG